MPADSAARPAQDRDHIDRAIHHASWLGAFAMFAYGAALSFDVLHTIALRHARTLERLSAELAEVLAKLIAADRHREEVS
jgi:hypothetical protein